MFVILKYLLIVLKQVFQFTIFGKKLLGKLIEDIQYAIWNLCFGFKQKKY